MSHARKLIRDAIKALLLNQTVAAERVWINRTESILQRVGQRSLDANFPAILVYTKDETARILNVAPREYLRTVDVIVELAIAITEDAGAIDDALDAFALQVENLLLVDDTVTGTTSDFRLAGSSMAIVDTGEIPIGAVQIKFEADYIESHPGAGLPVAGDALRTVQATTSLGGSQAAADRTGDTVRMDMHLVRARVRTHGVTVELELSETPTSATPAAGFTVTVAGTPAVISAGVISAKYVLLTVPAITGGQIVTVSYNATTGSIIGEDFELVAFTDRAAANFSGPA